MSQVIWVIQANMAQTNPALNDYVQGQTAAWAAAAATATTIAASAVSALCSGTTLQFLRGDGSLATTPVLGSAAVKDTTFFATAAQGALAASALQSFTETDPVATPLLSTHAALTTAAHGGIDAAGSAASAQAFSIQRANHTGTQTASTISNFSAAAISAVTWSTLTGKPTFANVATSGAYTDLSGLPTLGTQMSVDSGWTANSTVGDKTAALSSYSNGINSTIITALNLAAANSGTAIGALGDIVVTLVKQVAAIRTALVATKLMNV